MVVCTSACPNLSWTALIVTLASNNNEQCVRLNPCVVIFFNWWLFCTCNIHFLVLLGWTNWFLVFLTFYIFNALSCNIIDGKASKKHLQYL